MSRPRTWIDLAAAAGSGMLMAACQALASPVGPSAEWGRSGWRDWVGLVGLVPVLVRMAEASPGRVFFLGVVAGTVYFSAALAWVVEPMTTFAHIPWIGAAAIRLLLVSFLSLFWALAFWSARRMEQRLRIGACWSLPVVWVALSFLRNYLMTGFPWASVGYSQVRSLWLAQLASLCGVYLVTFAVILTNSAAAHVYLRFRARARPSSRLLIAWAALMALAVAWAVFRLAGAPAPPDARRIRVAVVQGNLDERARLRGWADQRWVFGRMLARSRLAEAEGAALVVWPEGSLPVPVRSDSPSLARTAGDPEPLRAGLVIGAIGRARVEGKLRKTNSAFITDGRLAVIARYDKRHLVPFGEYVPLASILPYQWFVPESTVFFSPGPGHRPLDTPWARLGMLICYEAIFPEISRQAVDRGAQLLVNITNDSWFGPSAAPYQHLVMSRMRSIETGRYQVRAANTGVSAAIDPRGRELARLPLGLAPSGDDILIRDDLSPPAHLVAEVALLDDSTPYCAVGDLFAWLCSLLTLAGLAAAACRINTYRCSTS